MIADMICENIWADKRDQQSYIVSLSDFFAMSFATDSSDIPPGQPRAGYTLPVFACAAAIAALRQLNIPEPNVALTTVAVNLVNPEQVVEIDIEQQAPLNANSALAITRSDPGDNLDLTRDTPVWAVVTHRGHEASGDRIRMFGGEGIGKHVQAPTKPAIYRYARELLHANLTPLLAPNQAVDVTIILPEGRSLATRTSNAAFGIVNGLSLLGTSGIAEPLSAPGQLQSFRETIHKQSQHTDIMVFCIGENGLDLARSLGIQPKHLIKTANWMGPLLVDAGINGASSILLFGYHGKLIKLAGGIFHTHHHLADGRHEIFAASCVRAGMPVDHIQQLLTLPTIEDALAHLRRTDQASGTHWVSSIYSLLAETIERRSHEYIYTHSQKRVRVGALLFDRHRNIIQTSITGHQILEQVC